MSAGIRATVWVGSLGLAAGARASSFSESDAVSGVRAALERGALAAVGLLGQTDGFWGNPQVRIALPGVLDDAARLLRATGQRKRVEALELAMNRAAEAAVPEARALLVSAIKSMSVEDARRLITGGDGAVTRFFVDKTREPLAVRFLPIVQRATQQVSLAAKYNAVAGKAAALGLLKAQDAQIERYVTEKALDGLFLMIAQEERKIRQDPVGTGSAILKKVFGGL
jgi:hypothetical protein